MSPDEMEGADRHASSSGFLTTTVNDIEHIESQSLNGVGVIKIYFQPGAKIEEAEAQVTAVAQTAIRTMPPGTQPPLIIRYSASTVPILQLSLGSDTLPEQQLFDISGQLPPHRSSSPIPGVHDPLAVRRQAAADHGRPRAGQALRAAASPPADVSTAINAAEPDPARRHGQDRHAGIPGPPQLQPRSRRRAQRSADQDRQRHDGLHPRRRPRPRRFHVADQHGPRRRQAAACCVSIYKLGNASTLDIVEQRQGGAARRSSRRLPTKELKITPLFDQSVFVRASVEGVVKEAAIAAGLTGADDPAVPGLLAEHADRLHLDPAVDPGVDHHALAAWARR